MNLVVDAGNTNIKLGAFEQNDWLWTETYTSILKTVERIQSLQAEKVLISSVGNNEEWKEYALHTGVLFLDGQTSLPITIEYHSRETLGTDRIAAACGASGLFRDKNCLFFDAGTCLTHGFIDQDGIYYGGSISPGVQMRLEALHHFTARLPYVALDQEQLTGNSTESSILSGVINGMCFEIDGFIAAYQNKYPDLCVLITGGNASLFEKRLKQAIFVFPELNLIGLNRILQYNV